MLPWERNFGVVVGGRRGIQIVWLSPPPLLVTPLGLHRPESRIFQSLSWRLAFLPPSVYWYHQVFLLKDCDCKDGRSWIFCNPFLYGFRSWISIWFSAICYVEWEKNHGNGNPSSRSSFCRFSSSWVLDRPALNQWRSLECKNWALLLQALVTRHTGKIHRMVTKWKGSYGRREYKCITWQTILTWSRLSLDSLRKD